MEIEELTEEEIIAKDFRIINTGNRAYYTRSIGDNTFVAIDDRSKHREIWGYSDGKKMPKDEAEELVKKIFDTDDESEVATIIEDFKESREATGTVHPAKSEVEAEVANMAMVMRYCVREAYPIVEQEIDCGGLSETSRAQMQQKLATTLFIAAMRRGL
ncbi:unnamed protein product [marine sediment metagenome]|uniref:Uncharacterized protein n=1 Tax=marine sediment metagenome TaxID=412755 RepID=X1DVX9_9ZZZZ